MRILQLWINRSSSLFYRAYTGTSIHALNEMAGMKSCYSKYKAWEPTEIINNVRLVHSVENVTEQKYNNLFGVNPIEKEQLINISSDIAFHNEIVGKRYSRLFRKREWAYESVPYWKNLLKAFPFSKSN